MNVKKFTYWQDEDMWIGYLSEFPDYMTQGESLDELKENLKDIYHQTFPGVFESHKDAPDLRATFQKSYWFLIAI